MDDMKSLAEFLGEPTIPAAMNFLFSDGAGFANSIVLNWKNEMTEQGLSSSYINRRLSSVRSLTRMARIIGLIGWSIEVENAKSEARRDSSGPGIEIVGRVIHLLEAGNSKKEIRDLALIRLMFDLGLRRAEVCGLDLEDVDLPEGKVWVLGKGRREKVAMSLPPATASALSGWIDVRGPTPGALFINFSRNGSSGSRMTGTGLYKVIRALGDRVDARVRPHGLRHTCISSACEVAARKGIPFEEVRQLSRHKNVQTLMVYRDRLEDLQGQLSTLVSEMVFNEKSKEK